MLVRKAGDSQIPLSHYFSLQLILPLDF